LFTLTQLCYHIINQYFIAPSPPSGVICRIAKRTASYLVTNGIIPSIDTGRRTWRYKILIDDVITYLRQREQKGSGIPKGAVNSREPKRRKTSFSQYIAPGDEQEVVRYFADICADHTDVLTTDDMAAMTGLHKKSFQRIIESGDIRFLTVGRRYFIPKAYFLEFVASRRFIDAWSNSEGFIKVLEGFQEWKQCGQRLLVSQ
jgi:excisionase family DNA binding protein